MNLNPNRLRELYAWSRDYEVSVIPAIRHWSYTALSSGLILGGYIFVLGALVLEGRNGFDGRALLLAATALGVLHFSVFAGWVHEASHSALVPGSPRWNTFLGRLVCTPFGVDYDTEWRIGHFIHHKNPVRGEDPQNCQAFTGKQLLRNLLVWAVIPGMSIVALARTSSTAGVFACTEAWKARRPARYPRLVLGALAILVGLYSVRSANLLLPASLVLSFSVTTGINLVKVGLEHGGPSGLFREPALRSRSSRFPLDFLILPFHIGLHFEHHLNPRIPWYELGRFHGLLNQRLRAEEKTPIFGRGFRSAWTQLRGESR
jgi:fatty acid desaturase